MKKYMVADLVKDLKEYRIMELLDTYNISRSDAEYIVESHEDTDTQNLVAKAMERFDLNRANAEIFVNDFPNESTWADVEEVAESLGVDITDVEDDDVENYMEMERANKGVLESSIGPIQWIYDNTLKAYVIHMVLEASCEGQKQQRDILYYKIEPEQMRNWLKSDSAGKYFNEYISGQPNENGCGCCDDPCNPQDVAEFNIKFDSIS